MTLRASEAVRTADLVVQAVQAVGLGLSGDNGGEPSESLVPDSGLNLEFTGRVDGQNVLQALSQPRFPGLRRGPSPFRVGIKRTGKLAGQIGGISTWSGNKIANTCHRNSRFLDAGQTSTPDVQCPA